MGTLLEISDRACRWLGQTRAGCRRDDRAFRISTSFILLFFLGTVRRGWAKMHLIVYGLQVRLGRQDKDVGWMHMGMRMRVVVLLLLAAGGLRAQSSQAAHHVVDTMLLHVGNTGEHSNRYMYLSEERSDRTSGHLWTERVAETSVGKVRLLVAEDGQTLNPGRAAAERARLADITAHPEAFQRREQAVKGDEQHAEQMLVLL